MEWLNYHHLLYFWHVVREGGVGAAATKLRISHPTVSAQIHTLERSLGVKLFERRGRRLALTDTGRLVHGYADEIFGLGRELQDAVKGRPTGRPLRLVVGVAEVVPKLVARRLLDPVLAAPEPVHLVCREDRHDELLLALARHEVDVVLADAPVPAGAPVRAYSHLLGECGVSFVAVPALARGLARRFPASLGGAPLLLPTGDASVRRSIDAWFERAGLRPRIVAEFDDSALLKTFGQDGVGVFPVPTAIEAEVRRQFRVQLVGRVPELRERFYALSTERRLAHPAIVAIHAKARDDLFAPSASVEPPAASPEPPAPRPRRESRERSPRR